MRPIGRTLASLLVGNQIQDGGQVQHWLRQPCLQHEPYLSHAEREMRLGVQCWQLSGSGQRSGRRRAQEPPLSGSGAVATEPGSDVPRRRASCDGASRARTAVHSGPCLVRPCLPQSTSQWASACRSRVRSSKAVSQEGRC